MPTDQAAWNKEMSDLQEHEKGHIEINRQGAHELDNSLPGTKGVASGSTAAEAHAAANKKLSAATAKKVKDEAARPLNDTPTMIRRKTMGENSTRNKNEIHCINTCDLGALPANVRNACAEKPHSREKVG